MSIAGPATTMDRIYRFQRHIYDPTRKYYLLGRDRLIEGLAPPPGGTVLEIGCGTARNLLRAARLYSDVVFYGIDVSREMLVTASRSVERSGLGRRVELAWADATTFDPDATFGRSDFSRVFFSYSLSMIPDWAAALERASALLSPEGELHIVDFGRLERLPVSLRKSLRNWLGLFGVAPRDGLEARLSALAVPFVIEHPLRGYTQLAICRRH